MQQTMRRATFGADWMNGTLPGYTDGKTWNGWAMPFFEFETAKKILADMGEDESVLRYDPDQDAFIYTNHYWPDEPNIYGSSFIEIEGRTLKVYGLGAGFWCWDENK